MKLRGIVLVAFSVGLLAAWGCGDDDDGDGGDAAGGNPDTGGTGGSTGGTGGSAGGTGGSAGGTGGSTGGTGGSAGGTGGSTGGSAGEAGNAGSAGSTAFWPGQYDPNGKPDPADGKHFEGQACMTCHLVLPTFLFGGTVYQSDGKTPAANVEVGVRAGTEFYSAYSASNGNFWVEKDGKTIDWSKVDVRLRNANGESKKNGEAQANCNSCHDGASVLKAP